MICKKCTASIPDDSDFCIVCGCKIESINDEKIEKEIDAGKIRAEETKAENEKIEETKAQENVIHEKGTNENKITKLPTAMAGLVVGVVLILFGLVTLFTTAFPLDTASFGADFYTYTYQGIYSVAQLLTTLVRVTSMGLIGFGIFLVDYFLEKKAQG